MTVSERLADVRERIARAARAAGRAEEEVRLIAVCKRQPLALILEAHDCGVRDFGENTVQGLCATADAFRREGREARWHFIGRLQRNKINKLLPHVSMVQSIDRDDLADTLDGRTQRMLPVMVQVNIGREAQKGGVAPEEAIRLACSIARRPHLELKGLMALPPYGEQPDPYFETMARLAGELRATPEGRQATELSMGMTEDFETAIRWGSTMVRVGTAIFGVRMPKRA
jgi:pyridoxal phosphate enzyme (YggS family)